MAHRGSFRGAVLAALLAAPVIVPSAIAPAGAAETAPAPAGLERLRHFMERTQSMRASFRQEILDGDQKVTEEARGRVALKRPGRFRWDYEQPYRRVVVADGKQLWLYEADLDQVTVRPLAAGLGETPAALLTGERDVLDRFEYVSSWTGDRLAWVRLKPRSADSDFESVAIAFAGDRPAELELKDRLGQQTHLYLTDVEMNAKVADDTFDFKVPAGVDVIREGEL